MKRFKGEIVWIKYENQTTNAIDGMDALIDRAILNDNIFKIDVKNRNGQNVGAINLRTKDNYRFDGSAKYLNDPRSSAMVNLSYYTNKNKSILIGSWVEDKKEFTCTIFLEEVEEFKN